MNTFKASSELKGIARQHMFGHYKAAVGAYVLMNLILISISMFINNLLPEGQFGALIGVAFTILISVPIEGILRSGFCYLFLNIACEKPAFSSYLFYGFSHDTAKAVSLGCLISAMQIVSMIPMTVCVFVFQDYDSISTIAIIIAMAILGIVGVLLVSLLFLPAFYLMHDFPEYTVDQILKKSVELMNGSMLRAFVLVISFIPVTLLSFLSLGIGAMWVEPYKEATYTEFFLDLIKNNN